MVVPEDDHGIEIVLSMELEDGALAKAPGRASFSIASVVHNSGQCAEHCSRHVKVEVAPFKPPPAIVTANTAEGPVEARAWDSRFAKLGLKFGPSFEGYSDINANPHKRVASAKIALNTTEAIGGQAELASVQLAIHMTQMRLKLGHHQSKTTERLLSAAASSGSSDAGQTIKVFASPFVRMVRRPDIRTIANERYRVLFPQSEEATSQVANVFDLMGHVNADLRVLEAKKVNDVGATREILKVLSGTNGIKRYRDYVVADVSEDLAASMRLCGAPALYQAPN
ncbi:hypothetical protein DL765_010201 [Monosporascus sp. GIB2]|nr:hypothetical protein DL765_010201 [Monosporascus sp. GIB2]